MSVNISPRVGALIAAITAAGLSALAGCSSADTPAPASTTNSVHSGSADSTAVSSDGSATGTALYTGVQTSLDTAESAANTATATGPTTSAPAATVEVPAPGGGNINETVAPVELTTNSAVPLTATADYGNGITVRLASIESVTTEANLPGEIAGPGVKVTVEILNSTSVTVDLSAVVVDLQDAAGTPAIPMSAAPAQPFTGSAAAGQTATGIYVFTVPTSYTNPATITVSYSTEAPIVAFVGNAN